ncbi:hypothetical protein [Methylomonas sp. AM2-LC]|uniref:hypothetical protein n=1 Tax=Methylomonas sp. AM2-LC TaxID=3153301 RepID=UPI003262EB20
MKKDSIGNVKLKLFGKFIQLRITVPSQNVTPISILPVLHKIDNKFVETAVEIFVDKSAY